MKARNGLNRMLVFNSLLAFMAALGDSSFINPGRRAAERHYRSAEEVAWLRERAAAKRARRLDRNRWNREMELCGRPQIHWIPLGIRWAIAHGYLKPKRRHGHAAH